jgi:hypothetical protein
MYLYSPVDGADMLVDVSPQQVSRAHSLAKGFLRADSPRVGNVADFVIALVQSFLESHCKEYLNILTTLD